MKGHSDSVRCLGTFSDYLFSGSNDSTVRMWHRESGTLLRTFEFKSRVMCLQAVDHFLYTGMADKTVMRSAIEERPGVTDSRPPLYQGARNSVTALSVHDDRVLVGSADNRVHIFDLKTFKHLNSIEGHTDWIRGLVFSPPFLYTCSEDGTVRRCFYSADDCEFSPCSLPAFLFSLLSP